MCRCASSLPGTDCRSFSGDFCRGFLSQGSHRWGIGFGFFGSAGGLQPWGIHQRGRNGDRFHCPRFRPGGPPGGTGGAGHHGGVSGHHRDMHHDGSGHSHVPGGSALRHGPRRAADHPCLCECLRRLGLHPDRFVPVLLCLCNGFGLGAVRRPVRPISAWKARLEALCSCSGRREPAGGHIGHGPCLDPFRDGQRSDGHSQSAGTGTFIPGGPGTYQRISMQTAVCRRNL